MSRNPRFSPAMLALAGALVATPAVASAQNIELRMATLAPPDSSWMKVLDKSTAEIAEKTGGRVTVKYYPGGVQGDERDVIRKIRAKQLDGASVTAVGLAMIDESIRVLELPTLFESIEEMEYVSSKMWPYFQAKFEKKGFRLQDRGEVGWIYLMSKNELKSVADIKSQKVWLWGDDGLVRAMYKQLGISGVPLGVPEVDSALSTGRINACYSSPLAAVALQWNTKVKFMTSMPMSYAIGATIIKNDVEGKLSAEDLKLVRKITKGMSKSLRKQIRKDNDSAKKQMERKGVRISQTPPELVADFDKAAQAVWADLTGKMFSKAELDMVLKHRADYRAKNPPKP